jgi:nitroreductase
MRFQGAATSDRAAELRPRGVASLSLFHGAERLLWAIRTAMLAVATLMLAAEVVGVSSGPVEGFDPGKVKEGFGVPDDHTVACLITAPAIS